MPHSPRTTAVASRGAAMAHNRPMPEDAPETDRGHARTVPTASQGGGEGGAPETRAWSLPSRLTLALVDLGLIGGVVAIIGVVMLTHPGLLDADQRMVAATSDLARDRPWLRQAAEVWSWASGPATVHPLVILTAWWVVARRGSSRQVLWAVPVAIVGWITGAVIKAVVDRPRPAEAIIEVGSSSFPSGHANNAALGAVLICALLWQHLSPLGRVGTTLVATLFVAVTVADRLVLGVHYPTDVTLGVALGALLAGSGWRALCADREEVVDDDPAPPVWGR